MIIKVIAKFVIAFCTFHFIKLCECVHCSIHVSNETVHVTMYCVLCLARCAVYFTDACTFFSLALALCKIVFTNIFVQTENLCKKILQSDTVVGSVGWLILLKQTLRIDKMRAIRMHLEILMIYATKRLLHMSTSCSPIYASNIT